MKTAEDKFAFPGSASAPDMRSGSGSSTSSSSSSSSDAADPDEDGAARPAAKAPHAGTFERRKLAKPEDLAGREAEDLDIAHYYMTTGAFLGSYNRAHDAVRIAPDDPDAHYALALAARGLKKNDEAAAEFKAYLDLSPDGEHRKAAQKALASMH